MRFRLVVFLVLLTAVLSLVRNSLRTRFQPVAVIVPHHDIVARERDAYFQEIARQRQVTNTVIIISPDHFSPHQTEIFYSDSNWNLHNGTVSFASAAGTGFGSPVYKNNLSVSGDHGIYNLLPGIHAAFPRAGIVPFIIGSRVSRPDLDAFFSQLFAVCGTECLLVASVDFSHYLPADLADIHDIYSVGVLSRLDYASYSGLEVDSPAALYLAMRFAAAGGATTFSVAGHTNSGHLQHSPDAESTSHLFASYSPVLRFSQPAPARTFAVASSLQRLSSVKGVGDRFFYGVDYLEDHLTAPYSPSPHIVITPASASSVIVSSRVLDIRLGPDLSLAGVVRESGASVLFLPLDSSASTFMRGDAKKSFLKTLFSSLPDDPGISPDDDSGIIILY